MGVAFLGAYHALSDLPAQTAFIRFLALSAFFLLSVSLMIGPLAVFKSSFAPLIEPRRAVGIAAFVFAALHFLLVASLYFGFDFGQMVSMFPLAIAMLALVVLLILALTATDLAVAKMGFAKWKTLQRFVYSAYILIFAHFILKANGLFSRDGKPVALNAAEVALVLLGVAAVALQVAAFFEFRKRKAAPVHDKENNDSP